MRCVLMYVQVHTVGEGLTVEGFLFCAMILETEREV